MRLSGWIGAYLVKFSKKRKGKTFPGDLLALYNFHGSGSGNGLRSGLLLLLLLAGHESSGGKSEDSDLLHNIY